MLPMLLVLALASSACGDPDPCAYEDVEMAPDDLTFWGTAVGDDFTALAGAYEGTWNWSVSVAELDIANSGVELATRATLEIDPTSYRKKVLVSTGRKQANDRFFCQGSSVLADGTLTIVGLDESPIVTIPVTLFRDESGSQQYASAPYISPISDFSTTLQALSRYELDEEGISGTLFWAPDGEWLDAEFTYVAQRAISETSGNILYVDVAKFHGER